MRQQFKSFHQLFSGHLLIWCLLIVASGVTSLDGIISPALIGQLTNTLTQRHYQQIPMVLLIFALGMALTNVSFFIWKYLWLRVRRIANTKLRSDALNSRLADFQDTPNTDVLTFINVTVKQIESQFVDAVIMLIYCIEQAVITLLFVIHVNFWVALIYLITGLIPALIPHLTQKWLARGTKSWQQHYQNYDTQLEDAVHGQALIFHYGVIKQIQNRLKTSLNLEEKHYLTMNLRQEASRLFANLSYTASTLISLGIGIWFVVNGHISVGAFISLYMAADRLTSPILSSVSFINQINATSPLLTHTADFSGTKAAYDNLSFSANVTQPLFDFQKIAIGYHGKAILKDLDFTIHQNEHALIIGRSGIGKSTLFKTLLGETPLLAGKIQVSDHLDDGDYRRHFGVIAQDTFVFSDTLRFNLALGETFDDTVLCQVLKAVGLS